MNNCIFCQIAAKQVPAKIIYENKHVICFLPQKIEVYGHTIIAPKNHFDNLYDIPEETLCEVMRTVKKLSRAYKQKINATGVNLLHASNVDAQQSVPHFHFHLLPRFKGDGLNTWPVLPKIDVNSYELWEKLVIS